MKHLLDMLSDFLSDSQITAYLLNSKPTELPMKNDITRRDAFRRLGQVVGLTFFYPFFSGCEPEATPPDSSSPKVSPLALTFEENDRFYDDIRRQLEEGGEVIVEFSDSEEILRKDSRFLTILQEAANRPALQKELHKLDTADGRRLLRGVFDAELVEWETVTRETHLGNDVVEPGTILLVAVVLLSFAVSVATVIQSVKYEVDIDASAGPVRFRIRPHV